MRLFVVGYFIKYGQYRSIKVNHSQLRIITVNQDMSVSRSVDPYYIDEVKDKKASYTSTLRWIIALRLFLLFIHFYVPSEKLLPGTIIHPR